MNAVINGRAAWPDYADLVRTWGIEEATGQGFTVRYGDVLTSIGFPDGLTEEHYDYFAPLLSDEDKAELARGVLLNSVRMSIDWEHVIVQECGPDVLDMLPALVESKGFDGVAEFIRRKVFAYRQAHSRRTSSDQACLFRRIQVRDTFHWHVRFLREDQVEEHEAIPDYRGMSFLKLLLQSSSSSSINSDMLEETVDPHARRPFKEDRRRGVLHGRMKATCDETQFALGAMSRGELDRLIDQQQVNIDRCSDQDEKARLEHELAVLKDLRESHFGLGGRRRRAYSELGIRQASDRIHRNLETCYAAMRQKGLVRLVGFLKKHIQRSEFGFRYLPPDPPIEWQF